MGIAFVFDEQMLGTPLAAVGHHNATGGRPVDATEVGLPTDLPRGTLDPDLLRWAEANGRIVVTYDRRTMPRHLAAHLAAGRSSPGVFVVDPSASLGAIVAFLELAAHAGEPADFADRITFVP